MLRLGGELELEKTMEDKMESHGRAGLSTASRASKKFRRGLI
jgi:hypothetical protein